MPLHHIYYPSPASCPLGRWTHSDSLTVDAPLVTFLRRIDHSLAAAIHPPSRCRDLPLDSRVVPLSAGVPFVCFLAGCPHACTPVHQRRCVLCATAASYLDPPSPGAPVDGSPRIRLLRNSRSGPHGFLPAGPAITDWSGEWSLSRQWSDGGYQSQNEEEDQDGLSNVSETAHQVR